MVNFIFIKASFFIDPIVTIYPIQGLKNNNESGGFLEKIFSEKWSAAGFLKFVFPSILGIMTMAAYTMVDSIFIARFVGANGIAAVNIIMPMMHLCFGLGIMTAAGSSAIIGIELGQKKIAQAKKHFSLATLFILFLMLMIIILSKLIGFDKIAASLGASKILLPYCVDYLNFFIFGIGAVCFQIFFEYFVRLDGKPSWVLYLSIAGGVVNILFDYLFIVEFKMGMTGAGLASTLGVLSAVFLGLFYFLRKSETLKFTLPLADFKFLYNSITNGSSEMITDIATAVKTIVFNFIIIKYAGEKGVAAMSVMMSLGFLLSSVQIGLSMGIAPVFSFNFGSLNFKKIRELSKHTIVTSFTASAIAFAGAKIFGDDLVRLYLKEEDVILIAQNGLSIFSFVFLFNGVNILSSGFFTSVNNGKISALIAILNSFVFALGFVFIFSKLFGLNGVWFSAPAAELATIMVSAYFLMKYKSVYITADLKKKIPGKEIAEEASLM